jgi:hypothetical protein
MIFQHLSSPAQQLIYDLSFIFSYSENVNIAEFGYNAEGVWLPQINIALFSAADTRLPVMIRTLPGSVRDGVTLAGSILLAPSLSLTGVLSLKQTRRCCKRLRSHLSSLSAVTVLDTNPGSISLITSSPIND